MKMRKSKNVNPFQESITNRNSTVDDVQSLLNTVRDHIYNKSTTHITWCGFVIRALKPNEVETLSTICRCQSDDWDQVLVMYNYYTSNDDTLWNDIEDLSSILKEQLSNCSFRGWVILGLCTTTSRYKNRDNASTDEIHILMDALKPGIKNNTIIKDSIISPGSRVYNNTLISDTFIGSTSSIVNCGSIHFKKNQSFTDDMEIFVGPESGGGRPVHIKPESTLVEICNALGISKGIGSMNHDFDSTCTITMNCNVVLGHLNFLQMGSNMFISEYSQVLSCPSVQSTILLPEALAKNSTIDSTFLQWKSSIIDSCVSNTILMECSDIGPNSTIVSTILGPDSHVSCGEVHCSLVGPNTNSHHQSLLISTLWPMGRGNVGYGSNIGSNHTGRIPDQECTVGEGIFWGLGCVVKFPVDCSRSFYSVIAAGVQLPPQSVSMPFSLIMSSNSSSTSGMNEIVPGWLIHSSPYTVLRSEDKFKKRRKAKRHDFYCGWRIIRPGVIDACWTARDSLLGLEKSIQRSGQDTSHKSSRLYTKQNLIELGENFMTERGRKVGIDAYTSIIQRYALEGLFKKISDILDNCNIDEALQKICALWNQSNDNYMKYNARQIAWPAMPWEENSYNDEIKMTDHQLSVLSREMNNIIEINSPLTPESVLVLLLRKIITVEQNFFQSVQKSKSRDDKRGESTIPNYNDAHVLTSSDPVVQMAKTHMKNVILRCEEIINELVSYQSRL